MRLAARRGVSRATVWRRLSRFRREGNPRAFLDQRRGTHAGGKTLDPAVGRANRDAARDRWHRSERATVAENSPAVAWMCKARDFTNRSQATVARCIAMTLADLRGPLVEMSSQELSRLEVIQRAIERRLTQEAAVATLGLSYRQTTRLIASFGNARA
jgi:hypothetical protein